jgi:YggT family protein
MCASALLITFLEAFITVFFHALTILIFGRVLLSWIPARLPWGLNDFVFTVTEPILAPIRRLLPAAAGMDFSPLIALIVIQYVIPSILLRVLPPTVPCL